MTSPSTFDTTTDDPSPSHGAAPSPSRPPPPLALVSRRGAWLALLAAVLVFGALLGGLRGATNSTPSAQVPASAESAQVDALRDRFPDAGVGTVVAVLTRDDGAALSPADLTAARGLTEKLASSSGHPARGPSASEDGRAAIVLVTLDREADNTAMEKRVDALRGDARGAAPAGTSVQITGGSAFAADIAGAFKGANFRLLLATVGIVALLLLITYRSPVLLLLPLSVVALADQGATTLAAALGDRWGWQFDAGILSVLVFGAGTNYALLLISRYREELRRREDHRQALAVAWRGTVGAIVASNLTVVLALLTLALAALPSTRGLGLASAVGLVLALLSVLFVLPPALAVVGRRAFWPFVPRPHEVADADARIADNPFGRVAAFVVRRPAAVLGASALILAVLAAGLIGTRVGLTQTEKFRVASESAAGLSTLGEHFPAGEAQPHTVIAPSGRAGEVTRAAAGLPGVVRANPVATSTDGRLVRISVVGTAAPDTDEAFTVVRELRERTHAIDPEVRVGGATATEADAREANDADLRLVAPLVMVMVVVVLALLLRSLVAPLLLAAINAASALAALGAGTFIGTRLFGFPALDSQLPLLAFLFLVALGIDYTIFLAHRVRHEAVEHGTRGGTVRAVAATGGVITSAGIVLAAVFAALGVLPLVVLGQLGLIVGVGVLIDTLFVRTIVVPALFALVGDPIWWPGAVRRDGANATADATVKA